MIRNVLQCCASSISLHKPTAYLRNSVGGNVRHFCQQQTSTEAAAETPQKDDPPIVFTKEIPPGVEEINATMFHPVLTLHRQVKNQHFGPVSLSESAAAPHESTSAFQQRKGELFDGVEYLKLPIVTVNAQWNNTKIYVQPWDKTKHYVTTSTGTIGFKGAKKKTDYAGEETGREAAIKSLERGCFAHVRVVLYGVGPGRRAAIRGLGLGGFTVVSITDQSPLFLGNGKLPQRPRKIRRI